MNLLNWTFFREVAIPQDIVNLLINGEQPVAAFATIKRCCCVYWQKTYSKRCTMELQGKK